MIGAGSTRRKRSMHGLVCHYNHAKILYESPCEDCGIFLHLFFKYLYFYGENDALFGVPSVSSLRSVRQHGEPKCKVYMGRLQKRSGKLCTLTIR
jgi:hypothetical protein